MRTERGMSSTHSAGKPQGPPKNTVGAVLFSWQHPLPTKFKMRERGRSREKASHALHPTKKVGDIVFISFARPSGVFVLFLGVGETPAFSSRSNLEEREKGGLVGDSEGLWVRKTTGGLFETPPPPKRDEARARGGVERGNEGVGVKR